MKTRYLMNYFPVLASFRCRGVLKFKVQRTNGSPAAFVDFQGCYWSPFFHISMSQWTLVCYFNFTKNVETFFHDFSFLHWFNVFILFYICNLSYAILRDWFCQDYVRLTPDSILLLVGLKTFFNYQWNTAKS